MNGIFKWLTIVAVILSLLVLLPVIRYWSLVSRFDGETPPDHPHEAGIVLGAALWDGTPSPALVERLNLAADLYHRGKVQSLIVSGGLGNDGITEAEAMKRFLTDRGVPADRIIKEDRSSNTKENLLYSARIIQEKKWTRITLITHDYHMHRALNYALQAGLSPTPSPAHSEVLFMPYHKARECLALVKQELGR
ncbi:YdcF family protein [Staphylospora marina]|uniref:YdcF family protein n=1 Tax=Staphylospora marina TaxID=2490858 RepID=UPI0013DE1451|nr:YdcF family protein [Staphylospora marina]